MINFSELESALERETDRDVFDVVRRDDIGEDDFDWVVVLEDADEREVVKLANSIHPHDRNRYYTTDCCGDEINLDEFLSELSWRIE